MSVEFVYLPCKLPVGPFGLFRKSVAELTDADRVFLEETDGFRDGLMTMPSERSEGYVLAARKYLGLSYLNFGDALNELRKGRRPIRRAGWNGAGQFVTIIYAGNALATVDGNRYPMQDTLGLKNAQGNMQPGWVPSQGDLFAEDWEVV